MSTLKKLAQATMILFAMMVLFSSCEKDEVVTAPASQVTENGATNGNFLSLRNGESEEGAMDSFGECFTMNFPITVNLPGEGDVSVGSDEELWETIFEYFEEAGDDLDDFPTIVFPISVTLEDGTVQSVANDEELCDLYHECYGDLDDDDWGDDDDWVIEDPCFDFAFPLTVADEDGNNTTVNNEEEMAELLMNGNYEYFEIVFPVNIVLADGTAQTIADEEALEDLYADCYGDDWGEPGDCDSTLIDEVCFEFAYPLEVNLPDGTTVTADDEETLYGTIVAYYEQNPNATDGPTLGYPLNVTLEDGTTQTINSDEELEELYEECFGDGFGLVNKNVVVGMSKMR